MSRRPFLFHLFLHPTKVKRGFLCYSTSYFARSSPATATAIAAAAAVLPKPAPSFLKEPDSNQVASDDDDKHHLVVTLCRKNKFEGAINVLFHQHGRVNDAVPILGIVGHPPLALYIPLFRLCLRHSAVDEARRVYAHSRTSGFNLGTVISNRLISLFSNSGCIDDARKVFDQMDQRDPCSWNTLIAGYSRNANLAEARRLFDKMCDDEKDSISWSSMMSGYVHHGRPMEALVLYREVQLSGRLKSSKFMVSSALAASTAIPCLQKGKEIHGHIIRTALASDAVVWSTLMDMYGKCGSIDEARHIFNKSSYRDVVSWTAMMDRYFDGGRIEEGFMLFSDMLRSGILPNEFTYAGVLSACSDQVIEGFGKQVHGHMIKTGMDPCPFAAAALIHMYSTCGDVVSAENIFKGIQELDLVLWSSMISCHAQNGQPEVALRYFELMLESGLKPDHVSFVGVLSACTHAGLIDKGLEIFHSIEKVYGLIHTPDHYACVTDLLSRSGRFGEVEEIINQMPFKPNKFLWASLLSGCRIHRNVKLARCAAEALFEMESENPATYVTLANIYATVGMWNDVARIRKRMSDYGVEKKVGASWIEVKSQIHYFLAGDDSHPRAREIYLQLEKLTSRMKEEGYVPETNFVLHDVEEEQKEQNLAYHSEKLAVAFGIIATPHNMPIKIFKNLRTCGDCHTAMKFISRIAHREIIVRDSRRFHHFKEGACTCKDYW